MYTYGVGVDRHWFITAVTYGSWLPGDARGFVGYHRPTHLSEQRVNRNVVDSPRATNMPALVRFSARIMTGQPIRFNLNQAMELLAQFQETARFRGWQLLAVSIMSNHFHAVVGVPGDPDPGRIRGDLKSYGSRRLNRRWGKPTNGSWWADQGSNRKLSTDESVLAAVDYTVTQKHPLVVWTTEIPELNLRGGLISNCGEPAA